MEILQVQLKLQVVYLYQVHLKTRKVQQEQQVKYLSSTVSGSQWIDIEDPDAITGAGTTGTITKWTTGGSVIGDSIIADDGSTITVSGNIKIPNSGTIGSIGTNNAITILSGGQVGIGGTPSYPLHVSGNVIAVEDSVPAFRLIGGTTSFDLNSDGGIFKIRDVSSGNELYHLKAGASGYHNWYINDSLKMTLDSSGNVGIGTSGTLAYLLTVSGTNLPYIASVTADVQTVIASDQTNLRAYIGTRTNHPIAFVVDGNEKMRISSGGEVKINTAGSGTSKLQVVGGIRNWNSALTLSSRLETDGLYFSGAQDVYVVSQQALNFYAGNALKMSISSLGTATFSSNVTAGGTLTVNGTGNSAFAGQVFINGLANYTGLTLTGSGGSRPAINFNNVNNGVLGSIFGTEGNAIIISANGINALTISSTGLATFSGTTSANVVISRDNMFVGTGQLYIGAENSSTNNSFRQEVSLASGTFKIQSRESGTWTDAMTINNGLNAIFARNIELYAGTTNHTLQFGTSSNWWYRFESSADDFIIRDANNTLIFFDHSSSDTYFVDNVGLVSGQLNGKTLAAGAGPIYLNFQGNGTVYAGSGYTVIWSSSDERIKSNIQDVNPTLEKVLALRSRKFNYKERPDHTNYGFIAQEVEQVMPEIVKTIEGITMCGDEEIVDQKTIETYGPAWAAILVKSIQEQQTIIESQKSLIDGLTTRIETLEG